MDMLQNVIGSLGGDQPDKLRDFAQRYQAGRPDEGYSDQEASESYGQLATRLATDEYEQSAEAAFSRLSPDQRRQFGEWLRERTGGQVTPADTPRDLAQATARVQQEQPNLLQQAFGEGGALSNPIAKIAVAGIAAMAAQRLFGNR
jgi:hypothetical protein